MPCSNQFISNAEHRSFGRYVHRIGKIDDLQHAKIGISDNLTRLLDWEATVMLNDLTPIDMTTGAQATCHPITTKLERYQLIVWQVTDILSIDQRAAYDRYGSGSNGQPDALRPRDTLDRQGHLPAERMEWTHGPSKCHMGNWEKWYQRDANGPQEPRFVG